MTQYKLLDPLEVVATTEALTTRIRNRFAESDRYQVSMALHALAKQAQERAIWMAKPLWWMRLLLLLLVAAGAWLLVYARSALDVTVGAFTVPEFVQALEAGTSELLIVGAGVVFLVGIETRVKRARGLKALHELRALAHIIDMHQLTKDPARLDRRSELWTAASPESILDAFLLTRYLDYCSEMLSLLGKIAALYSQRIDDPVLLDSVDDIEDLTTTLSGKIWQKIMVVAVQK